MSGTSVSRRPSGSVGLEGGAFVGPALQGGQDLDLVAVGGQQVAVRLVQCILMLLYIVKGFGVLGWLVRGGDGLDPECGASFEFG